MYLNYNVDTENMPKQGNNFINSAISISKQMVVNNALASRMPQNPQDNQQPQPVTQPQPNQGWGRTNN